MINLLPPKEKQELLQEETKRLVVILGVLVLIFLLSLILLLLSAKIYTWGQTESQNIILNQAHKEFEESDIQNLEQKIILINQDLSRSTLFYQEKTHLTGILERISEILPSESYLTNLSYTPPREKTKAQFSLSGFSPTREILSEFKKNLEEDNNFTEVYFPPSNWVKPTNINFSVTLQIR